MVEKDFTIPGSAKKITKTVMAGAFLYSSCRVGCILYNEGSPVLKELLEIYRMQVETIGGITKDIADITDNPLEAGLGWITGLSNKDIKKIRDVLGWGFAPPPLQIKRAYGEAKKIKKKV